MVPNLLARGVYRITNIVTGRHYVGSTSQSFRRRWAEHRRLLNSGEHFNAHLQSAWVKYGSEVFEWTIIESVSEPNTVLLREQYWIDCLANEGKLYNLGTCASAPMKGRLHTRQTRDKIARSHAALKNVETGKIIPAGHNLAETCRQYGLPQTGLWAVLNGRVRQYKGWVAVDAPAFVGKDAVDAAAFLILGKAYPAFVNSDTGEVIPAGTNLSKLCRIRGFPLTCMNGLVRGTKCTYKGWKLLDGGRQNRQHIGKEYPVLWNMFTSEVIFAGQNLSNECKMRGLDISSMWKMIKGANSHCKGWVVFA